MRRRAGISELLQDLRSRVRIDDWDSFWTPTMAKEIAAYRPMRKALLSLCKYNWDLYISCLLLEKVKNERHGGHVL